MKKILILVTRGEIGGAQIFVLNLARELKKIGHEVMVGFGDGDFLKNELKNSSLPYYRFKYLRRTNNIFSNILFILELKIYLNKNKFNVVHFNSSNTLPGAISAKLNLKKIKTVFTHHGISYIDPSHKAPKIIKTIYLIIFKILSLFIDTPVFVSKTNYEIGKKYKIAKNGLTIYNGLNPQDNFLDPGASRQKLSEILNINLDNKFIIGTIGRFAYPKNYEFIIETFPKILAKNKNAIFIMIGDGPEKEKYQKLIKNLNLQKNIFLTGEVINAGQYLKGFGLFTLPSIYEGLSMTLIESLFAGTPILASDVGGSHEVVNNSPEQLYKLNNQEEFFKKITNIIINPQLRKKLSEENLRYSNKFSLDETIEKYNRIYIQN